MATISRVKVHHGQRSVRWVLIALELFAGVGAVYGALMLVRDSWRLPLDYLDPLPLHSWVLPGIALFGLVAVPMLAAAVLVWRRAGHAADVSIGAGVLLAGWIAVQLAVIGPRMALQAIMAVIGLAVAGLGWWWRRSEPRL
jgi:hypothetical protein